MSRAPRPTLDLARGPFSKRPAPLAAGLVGLAAGAAPALGGLYDLERWAPVGIAALLAGLVCLISVRRGPAGTGLGVLAGLTALAAIQVLSSLWAEADLAAEVDGFRTMTYAAVLGLVLLLVRERRALWPLVLGYGVGLAAVAAADVTRLATADDALFIAGRLDAPLGYANGLAGAFAMGVAVWLGIAVTARRALVAGAATAVASVLLSLVLLCQSRGALLALVAAALLTAALCPQRRRTLPLVVVLGAVATLAYPSFSAVYDSAAATTGLPAAGKPEAAAVATLLSALACGLAGTGLVALLGRLPPPRALRGRARTGAIGAAAAVTVAAVLVIGPAAIDELDAKWDGFRSLSPVTQQSRLSSPGGNRYDYWRIALDQFADHPLVGVGAGNYPRTYFLDRRTTEDIRQPHSLPLQVLAETGLAGFAAFLIALAAVIAAFLRARRAVRDPSETGQLVAAVGALTVWAVHTSVDWLHLLPGVTAGALVTVAVLVGLGPAPTPRTAVRRRSAVRPVAFAAMTLAAAQLAVVFLVDHRTQAAREALAKDPAQALDDARRAIELNDGAVDAYVVLAAAQARLDRYSDARDTLLAARRRVPHDPVLPALLGDLATRHGSDRTAVAAYTVASRLDPRNEGLRQAAAAARDRVHRAAGSLGS